MIQTATRVEQNTKPEINEAIRRLAAKRLAHLATSANEEDIRQRVIELEGEWDVERALETNAAVAVLATLALGKLVDKRFYAATAVIGGFLLNYALRGWCPPIPILRLLGFRTAREIEDERHALLGLLHPRGAPRK